MNNFIMILKQFLQAVKNSSNKNKDTVFVPYDDNVFCRGLYLHNDDIVEKVIMESPDGCYISAGKYFCITIMKTLELKCIELNMVVNSTKYVLKLEGYADLRDDFTEDSAKELLKKRPPNGTYVHNLFIVLNVLVNQYKKDIRRIMLTEGADTLIEFIKADLTFKNFVKNSYRKEPFLRVSDFIIIDNN